MTNTVRHSGASWNGVSNSHSKIFEFKLEYSESEYFLKIETEIGRHLLEIPKILNFRSKFF